MRAREVGFTLLEYVITVGIAAILLAAGGFWLLAMHPAALAGALDDFDANLAAAKAIAASSGNGATLVFAPQTNGSMGYTLTVYSGRPNAADAVSATNVMIASSAASVSEAHFGKPPFAIFLSSAGYPTGTANYPALSAQGAPSFNVIAAQPPCPSGGIELTFTSPQGATATRTLPCNQVIAQSSAPDATPTPNAPHVSPTYLLAHDTTDAGPLKFKAAEYGYFQPFVAQGGPPCSTIASETGAAPAVYTSPYPDSQPTGDPNDPPAWFALAPVLHNGGMCTATVADAYGQSGSVTVQVMGDLTASTTSLSLQVGKGNGVVAFTKTFDSEQLLLSAGGACLGIVTAAPASGSYPSSPSTTPANANVTVTPVAQGACTMIVQDQYGERIPIGINVKAANQPFASWPATLVLGAGGSAVGATSGTLADADTSVVARIAPVFNALLGGGIARAAAGAACYGLAMNSAKSGIDATLPPAISAALGIYVDTSGCIVNASDVPIAAGEMIAYEPVGSGQTGNFGTAFVGNCVSLGSWSPNLGRNDTQASLSAAGSAAGSCIVDLTDGASTQTPAPDAGAVAVAVNACDLTSGAGSVALGTSVDCSPSSYSFPGDCGSDQQNVVEYFLAFNDDATSVATLDESSGYGSISGSLTLTGTSGVSGGIVFTRAAVGTVTLYEYEYAWTGTYDEVTGVCVIHSGFDQNAIGSVTLN